MNETASIQKPAADVSGLAVEINSLLIGESASPKTLRAMREFLSGQPDVVAVAGLVTLQQGEIGRAHV